MTAPQDPPWLALAREQLGVTEMPGKETAPAIARWLLQIKAWWQDDETPWCGTFVGAMLQEAGFAPPAHPYRAKAYANGDWGILLARPCLGAICVFERKGGGHVNFSVAEDRFGTLICLGGNQREAGKVHTGAVTVGRFARSRFIGAFWPRAAQHLPQIPLPVVPAAVGVSENEA